MIALLVVIGALSALPWWAWALFASWCVYMRLKEVTWTRS